MIDYHHLLLLYTLLSFTHISSAFTNNVAVQSTKPLWNSGVKSLTPNLPKKERIALVSYSSNAGGDNTSPGDDDDNLFFDDFGGSSIGGGDDISASSNSAATTQLLERISEVKEEEVRKDNQLAKNWRTGNWKVRGFSLDKTDPLAASDGGEEDNDKPPIHVSCIDADQINSPDRIVVGRTDGSVCIVTLGTEYLAKFAAKLTTEVISNENDNDNTEGSGDANEGDDKPMSPDSVRIQSELVRTDSGVNSDDKTDLSEEQTTPFEVLHTFKAHDSSIKTLLVKNGMIFTTGQDSFDIKVWSIPEDDDELKESGKLIPFRILTNAHNGPITALKTLSLKPASADDDYDDDDHNLLLSTAADGSFAIWDISTGDMIFRCVLVDENDGGGEVSITCADADGGNTFYLGLQSGYVIGYVVNEIIENYANNLGASCPVPNCRFLAHDRGISAIRCAGVGSLAQGRPGVRSEILLTGSNDGAIKQWEILSRKPEDAENGNGSASPTKLEHWPRLSSQRMQRRAHLFSPGHSDGPVTALNAIDPSKFISAGADGTVRAWSPSKGTELFRMDGFVEGIGEEGSVTSLCLDNEVLITNGMAEFVCVHDFMVNEDEFENGYELEW